MIRSVREAMPRVHREGWPFIAATLLAALVFAFLFAPLFWLTLILAGWMAAFFRDPKRVVPVAPGLVLSPADGRIEPIVRAAPPPELGLGEMALRRVSVFMNVFDCHVTRSPVAGRVLRIAYKAGKFVSADLDKASAANERNGFVIALPGGGTLAVVQIAGLVARRIVTWTREGAEVVAGERIGMIRFGSRLDVYLPEDAVLCVAAGQRAVGGETVIATLGGNPLAPPFETRLD
jgi:phosphatidylserine decarboxylase